MSTSAIVVAPKPNYSTVRWAGKSSRAQARTSLTVARHVAVLEAVAAAHGGVLPPYKWLNENGYFTSYNIMLDHPRDFRHIKTYEQSQAEMYERKPGEPAVMRPKKFRTLAEYNVKGAHFSPTELAIDNGVSEKEWMAIGRAITLVRQSTDWWVGDFLQYGFRTYGKTATFDLAKQATGYTRSALYSCANIAKRFPPARRIEALTLYHHKQVAGFPPAVADRLLAEAVEFGFTGRQLKEMGEDECGKKEKKFAERQLTIRLGQKTFDAVQARAHERKRDVRWFIVDIVESFLTGKPVERYANGRKLKEFKAAIIAAQKAGEL